MIRGIKIFGSYQKQQYHPEEPTSSQMMDCTKYATHGNITTPYFHGNMTK